MKIIVTVTLSYTIQPTDDKRAEGKLLELLDSDGDRLAFIDTQDEAIAVIKDFVGDVIGEFPFILSREENGHC